MSRFKTFVSRNYISVLFTLFSILIINVRQLIGENFGWDNSFSVAAAINIADGHGYTLRMATPDDLSKVTYEPLNKFPPGYSLLLVVVHAISFTDWVHSIYLLNALGLTVLVMVLRRMLYQLEFPAWIINLTLLYFGFVNHPYMEDHYTDLFGVVFFISGCSCLIQIVRSGTKLISLVILAALLFSFCAYFKYLYMPVIFVPFLFLLYYGKITDNTVQIRSAFIGTSVITILLAAVIVFQYFNSGTAAFISPVRRGFFPEQLLSLGHIYFASFISIGFIYQELARYTSIPLIFFVRFGSIINFLLLVWIGYSAVNLLKRKKFAKGDAKFFYAMLSSLVTISIFTLLASLTIIYYKDLGILNWVYIQELRYYGPVYIMILQFSIFVFLYPEKFLNPVTTGIFRIFVVIMVAGQVFHSTHAIIKQVFLSNDFGANRLSEKQDFLILNLASHEILNGRKVVVWSSRLEIPNIASISGSSSLFDVSILNEHFV